MNAQDEAGPPKRTGPAPTRPHRRTTPQPSGPRRPAADRRRLAAYLRERSALRVSADRAAALAEFLTIANRRAEAVAAANIAAELRQALR